MALEKTKKAPPCKIQPGDKVIRVQYSAYFTGTVIKVEWSSASQDHLVTLKRSLGGLIIHYAADLSRVPQ